MNSRLMLFHKYLDSLVASCYEVDASVEYSAGWNWYSCGCCNFECRVTVDKDATIDDADIELRDCLWCVYGCVEV